MTKFVAADFDMGYGSERYVRYQGKFVARFKYLRPAANAKHFVKFLCDNFTVEEYFSALEVERKSPLVILGTKGYVSPNEKRARESQARYEAEKNRPPMKLNFV